MKTQGNRENVLSPYALWGLAGPRRRRRRTSCVRRLSSFDDRQAMYEFEASCHYTGFLSVSMTTKHAQSAWKWMYKLHAQAPRIAEPKHSQQIDRVRSDDVLAKEHCLYERDRRLRCEDEKMSLRLSAMCGLLLFFSEVNKDVVDPRQAATQLEEEQPFTVHVSLERCLSTDGKTTGQYEFGSVSSWSSPDWSPWQKPERKSISLHDRSWAWRTRLFKFKWRKPCVGLRHFFFGFFCQNSFDRGVGQFAGKWLAFLAMVQLVARILVVSILAFADQTFSAFFMFVFLHSLFLRWHGMLHCAPLRERETGCIVHWIILVFKLN